MESDIPNKTHYMVDNLFRREGARIVSTLTRIFGMEHLELAEDVVQEALLKALQQWPYSGIPDNPPAWIMQVARNRALDVLRRRQTFIAKEKDIASWYGLEGESTDKFFLDHEVRDDELRMLFVCCHPLISVESQIALILKILCGFSIAEIGRAFLSSEETIHKRLVRAKRMLREIRPQFEIPGGTDLATRLDTVLKAVYLLFNEGYNASQGERLVRAEFSHEAIRLTRLLSSHSVCDRPKTHALLSLMLLHAARFTARLDDLGQLILLQDQDRRLWDRALIAEGLEELDRSAGGEKISEYHLQAGISACHCLAESYEATDWSRILMLYEMLVYIDNSPIVLLNRAVAIAKVHGPRAGIHAITKIKDRKRLEKYYLLHAVLGEFSMELGNSEQAAKHYRKALEFTRVKSERMFLSGKLKSIIENLN